MIFPLQKLTNRAFDPIRFNHPFSSSHQCSLYNQLLTCTYLDISCIRVVLLPEITVEFALSIVVADLEVTNVPSLCLGDATFERDIEPVGIPDL